MSSGDASAGMRGDVPLDGREGEAVALELLHQLAAGRRGRRCSSPLGPVGAAAAPSPCSCRSGRCARSCRRARSAARQRNRGQLTGSTPLSSLTTMTVRVSQSEAWLHHPAQAFVYDHLRTPRGKGKAVGGLHEVKPVDLMVGLLEEVQVRNPTLDLNRVDDVVLGVVSPIGEQGGDIAKTAALAAGLPRDRGRRTAEPLLRLRAGGGQPGRVTRPQRVRGPDPGRRRRVDEPGADGLRRRRLGDGPGHRADHRFRPAGHRRRPDRDARGLGPRGRRRLRRRVAPSCRQGVGQRLLRRGRRTGQGRERHDRAGARRAGAPGHLGRGPGRPQAELRLDRTGRRLRRRRTGEVPLGRADRPRASRGQLLRHRRRRLARGRRHRGDRRAARAHAARPHRDDGACPVPTPRSC